MAGSPAGIDQSESSANASSRAAIELPASSRMVVRSARVELRNQAVKAVCYALEQVAAEVGGYISATDSAGVGDDLSRVEITLRVPAERFGQALVRVRENGEVLHGN